MFKATKGIFSYPKHRSIKLPSFTLSKGDILFLMGPNGSGKTTFLKLCAGLLRPDKGAFFLEEKSLYRTTTIGKIGYLGSSSSFDEEATVEQTISLLCHLQNTSIKEGKKLLQEFHLLPFWKSKIKILSQGQRLKLALVRLCLQKRLCWILDEPLNGLDTLGKDIFIKILKKHLNKKGIAFIATHSLEAFSSFLTNKSTGVKVYKIETNKKNSQSELTLSYSKARENL